MKKKTKGFIIGLTATALIGGGVTAGVLLGDDVKGTSEMDDLNKTIAVKANVDSFDLDRYEVYSTNYSRDMLRLCGIAQKGEENSNINLFYMIDEDVANGLRDYCAENCGDYYGHEIVGTDKIIDDKAMIALLNKAVERDMMGYVKGEQADMDVLNIKFTITEYTYVDKNDDGTCTFTLKGLLRSKNEAYESKQILTEFRITQPYSESFENHPYEPVNNYIQGKEGVVIEFVGAKELESVQEAVKTYKYEYQR